MWIVYVMTFFLALVSSVTQARLAALRERIDAANSGETRLNFGVYGGSAVRYALANPGFSGIVSRGLLSLPTWYVPRANLSAYVSPTRVLVFETEPNAIIGSRILRGLASNDTPAGLVVAGQVVSPTNATMFPAPSGIPNNSVVLVVR